MNLISFGFSYRDPSRFARGALPTANAQILIVILGVATIRATEDVFISSFLFSLRVISYSQRANPYRYFNLGNYKDGKRRILSIYCIANFDSDCGVT
jgi:hypothetical protein